MPHMKRLKLMNKDTDDKAFLVYNPLQVNVVRQQEDYFQHENDAEDDPKWSEFKILGHYCIYGGYQIDQGILEDFWKIALSNHEYHWEKIEYKNMEFHPGKRFRHSAVCYRDKMFIFGGLYKTQRNDNKLFIFDFQQKQWSNVQKDNWKFKPPKIDSHAVVITQDGKMIVLCGYEGDTGEFSNGVLEYSIEKNNWDILFSNDPNKNFPKGRACTAASLVDTKIYIFGGNNSFERMNDLWYFDLINNSWNKVEVQGFSFPKVRCGHTMVKYNNFLILFGGLHTITWELDDCFLFDLSKNQWNMIDQDSARKKANLGYSPALKQKQKYTPLNETSNSKDQYAVNLQNSNDGFQNKNSLTRRSSIEKKKGLLLTKGNIKHVQNQQKYHNSIYDRDLEESESNAKSPTKTTDEQKMKLRKQKKTEMLKLFEQEDNFDFLEAKDNTPTSQAMSNSLIAMGNPFKGVKAQKPGKYADFGRSTISKFNMPLTNSSPTRQGKRPCARDGHQACIYNDVMLIFGGDRHNMSFNNIFMLDLQQVIGQAND